MRPPADGDAGAGAAPEDHCKNDMVVRARAVHRLRSGQTVGVIFDSDLAPQRRSQIAFDRTTEQPGGTGAFAKTGFRFQRTRNPDSDWTTLPPGFLLDAMDQTDNDSDAAFVIVTRCLFSQANDFVASLCEGDSFYFCAAPIDSDEHISLFFVCIVRFDSDLCAHPKQEVPIPRESGQERQAGRSKYAGLASDMPLDNLHRRYTLHLDPFKFFPGPLDQKGPDRAWKSSVDYHRLEVDH
jgi:hypothetical protein